MRANLLQIGWILPVFMIFAALWFAFTAMMARLSGWSELAESYGTAAVPRGRRYLWQYGSVGPVGYRWCLNIWVADDGIFLRPAAPYRAGHQPLFIPLTAITPAGPRRVLWWKMWEFQVGVGTSTSLVLPARLGLANVVSQSS